MSDLELPIHALPVPLTAIQAAFSLPEGMVVDSFHAGVAGAWRTVAPSGAAWSVKVLPANAAAHQIDTLRTAGALERRAHRAGLDVVPPVEPDVPTVGLAARVGSHFVWLHEWVPAAGPVGLHALHRWLGEVAARLHALWPVGHDHDADLAYGLHSRDLWSGWFDEATAHDLPWAALRDEALRAIEDATDLVSAGLAIPGLSRCVSHRDLSPSNVVHGPSGPLLCDFGFSGVDVPWFEIVDAALAFGQSGPETIDAYLRAGGHHGPEDSEALAHGFGGTMTFLSFSMWVSLGHRRMTDRQRAAATDRIPSLVRDLIAQLDSLDNRRRLLFGS
jgi:hypothetical protein